MKEFRIVDGTYADREVFVQQMNELMADRWELQGQVTIAMVRDELRFVACMERLVYTGNKYSNLSHMDSTDPSGNGLTMTT